MSTLHMTISFALENFAFPDAIFLSERLHAEVGNDESLFMLADSYYRSGKANVAYSLLTEKHSVPCKSAQCLFLLARCCYDLEKYAEALNTLTGPFNSNANVNSSSNPNSNTSFDSPKQIAADELIKFFGEKSSFVAQLLGAVYLKLDGAKMATHYYTVSLKINPFLWSSYEKLLQIDPSAVEPAKLFVHSPTSLCYSSNNNISSSSLALNSVTNSNHYFNPNHHVLHNSTHQQQQHQHQNQNQQNQQQQQQSQQSCVGPLRRSSRLYSNNCIKENTGTPAATNAAMASVLVGGGGVGKAANVAAVAGLVVGIPNLNNKPIISRTPTKRSRRKISFEKSSGGSGVGGGGGGGGSDKDSQNENQSHGAIEEFGRLPGKQAATGYVLSAIGRAYFEMSKYDEAIEAFKRARTAEPHRLQGMEIYSTALWHKQKEVELSCLAQTLIDFDRTAPETWCVAGNCFSLQKEHEISIKFLKRAIQVDPAFCYAYTLLGHELVSADELDNAMACFRNATRLDGRHYNAWYGIGMIYYKQEKYPHAYSNYKRALEISPYNPILMCHLAIVCHHMKKTAGQERRALELLDRASALDPNNALVKFHRASINFATENYKVAMDELEELKKVVPKESMVYFLIGKIHKIRGETHLALMNFSWAMDLDPKGASNQIKELIDRHYGNDEEIMIHSSSLQDSSLGGAMSLERLLRAPPPPPGTSAGTSAGANGLNLLPNMTPLQERSSTLSPTESAHSTSSSSSSSSAGSSLSPAPSGSGGGAGGGSELGSEAGGSSSLLSAGSAFGDSSLL
ncbi:anaphase-promoting complex subunit cdc27 [Tyrophagus putrescentiae]|nr:anaphase-promoting complex subunit cdc27 [Tyrophagus putrescentiae]